MNTPASRPMTDIEIELFVTIPKDLDRMRGRLTTMTKACNQAMDLGEQIQRRTAKKIAIFLTILGATAMLCVLFGPKMNVVAYSAGFVATALVGRQLYALWKSNRKCLDIVSELSEETKKYETMYKRFLDGSRDYFAQRGLRLEDLPRLSEEYHRSIAEGIVKQN